MPIYSDILLDHFHNPRNLGEIDGADAIGDASNGTCGDLMRLFMNIREGKVTEAQFMTLGCAAAIATGSMLTEMIRGKMLEDALKVTNAEVAAALGGLPAEKIHCSVLAEQALQSAVTAWRERSKRSA